MVKKDGKNINYSKISDAFHGKLLLHKKEVKFVLKVFLSSPCREIDFGNNENDDVFVLILAWL